MTEKITATSTEVENHPTVQKSRVLPLAIAGVVCFVIAVFLGYGSWYLFGAKSKNSRINAAVVESQPIAPAAETTPSPAPVQTAQPAATPEKIKQPEIEGTVNVAGTEFATGGGETKLPIRRTIIGDFAIAETEVTNEQYAAFVTDAKHSPPPGWKSGVFPQGEEKFPVTGVSWTDAQSFCEWMSKKSGQIVRLPSEAEWELAARGAEGLKYPWGNEWKKDAAVSSETGGKISAVKSSEVNRSPFGAYDMAGNVWEWTQDKLQNESEASDQFVVKAFKNKQVLRIVKGGTSKDRVSQISAQARYEIPENTKVPEVGFRYVVAAK